MKEYLNKVIVTLYVIIIVLVIKHKCLQYLYIKSTNNSRPKISGFTSRDSLNSLDCLDTSNRIKELINPIYINLSDESWGHFVYIDDDVELEQVAT